MPPAQNQTQTLLTENYYMTKLKTSLIGALLVAGVTVSLKMHHQAQTKLRAQSLLMQQQNEELARLNSENARLSKLVSQANEPREQEPSSELLSLRREVGMLRKQLAASVEHQARRTDPTVRVEHKQEGHPYYGAETWANVGYQHAQSAAITYLWALRNTNQVAYNGAFGRDVPELEVWADAYKRVKGTFLSDPVPQPNGDMQVTATHETTNGEMVEITYHQEQGQWLIRGMNGFPMPKRPPPIVSSQ